MMNLNTSVLQVQKQLLAPVMQQSIQMLLLPITELTLSISQELQNNPLLEIDEERLTHDSSQTMDEILKAIQYSSQLRKTPLDGDPLDDDPTDTRPLKMETTLEDELLQQLRVELSDPLEIKIGEIIIGSLNEDGYLTISTAEIAQIAGTQDLVLVEYILKIIQNFEPLGIAARNLKECLLSQVTFRCNGSSDLVRRIIDECLEDLAGKHYHRISRKLNISLAQVQEAARLITLFEPRPARNYRPVIASPYIKPDIFITQDENGKYVLSINHEGIPPLRINAQYQKMLRQNLLSDSDRAFIREKIKNAIDFIKSIEQRGTTIQRICEYILDKQKNFFDNGPSALTPMTLHDIAQAIGRNPSTISRAISHKYIDTPQGVFPLKFFFSQGIQNQGHAPVASRGIKEELKELISSEDKTSPLSDQEIQEHFQRKNITLARRTITKYRQTMKILPSHLRKI